MASSDRWAGLGSQLQRAATEIYALVRQEGHANMREWWQAVWGAAAPSQQRSDTWHSAVVIDMRIAEFSRQGPEALAAGLASDDVLEGLLRQLASARELALTGDVAAANRILGFRMPGEGITPGWLLDDARTHSTAIYKQGRRARGGEGRGRGAGRQGRGDGEGTGRGGDGRGRGGRGGGRGRQPAAAGRG